MCHVGSLTMIRRTGLLCCSQEARMFILSDVVVTVLSWRLKMDGYVAKESVFCCFLHTSANVETRDGGRGSLGVFSTANGCVLMGS